jgi:putative ABC transport system permease protein
MLRSLKQVLALSAVSFQHIPQRAGSYLVIVLGVAGVVAVLLSVLAISGSLVRTIAGSGRDDRAIVLQQSAVSENGSIIERGIAARIQSAPGIRKLADGHPIVSTEAIAPMFVREASAARRASVIIRGASSTVFELRPEVKLISGRAMRPGFYELIVGKKASEHFKGLKMNKHVKFRNVDWMIVGVFTSDGDAHEMEMMTDIEMLMSATQRNALSSISVQLESVESYREFKNALASDISLTVKPARESEYYRLQSEPLRDTWSFVAYVVSGIMALGATVGAANTMYSAVSARSVEFATFRAVGFAPNAVLISLVVEATIFAVAGALFGVAVVWILLSGHTFSASAGASRVATQLSLTPQLVMLGVGWGCAISILGALIPAIRELRRPIAAALRAV